MYSKLWKLMKITFGHCYFYTNFYYFRINGVKIIKIDIILYINFCYFCMLSMKIVKTDVKIFSLSFSIWDYFNFHLLHFVP